MNQPRSARSPVQPMILVMALAAAVCGPIACGRVSEIILVVDTDMAIPAELDHIQIAAMGTSGPLATIPALDLQDPSLPPFPLTLGLVDKGNGSALQVKVIGIHGPDQVTVEDVHTAFVPGEKRTLRIVLTAACLGVKCMDSETCSLGKCVALDRPGDKLPSWTGVPPRAIDEPPMKIGDRTLWSAGWRTCATQGQNVYCWGDNDSGQMGNGQMMREVFQRLPLPILPKPISSIGLGFKHTCVCDTDGQAWCWGANDKGQVGSLGAASYQLTPVQVPEVSQCVQIAGGGAHTCAIVQGGSLWCWGNNNKGQLGQPAGANPVTTPQRLSALGEMVSDVGAGENYTCAVTTIGATYCWGDNGTAELGDGTTVSRSNPVRPALPLISQLSVGRFFALVRSSKTVWGWGEDPNGTLGPNSMLPLVMGMGMIPVVLNPIMLMDLNNVIDVRAGHQHACALRDTGVMSCWGNGQNGKLGNGQSVDSFVPLDVTALAHVSEIAVGFTHTCARNPSGVYCWGDNTLGQLGIGPGDAQISPVEVIGF